MLDELQQLDAKLERIGSRSEFHSRANRDWRPPEGVEPVGQVDDPSLRALLYHTEFLRSNARCHSTIRAGAKDLAEKMVSDPIGVLMCTHEAMNAWSEAILRERYKITDDRAPVVGKDWSVYALTQQQLRDYKRSALYNISDNSDIEKSDDTERVKAVQLRMFRETHERLACTCIELMNALSGAHKLYEDDPGCAVNVRFDEPGYQNLYTTYRMMLALVRILEHDNGWKPGPQPGDEYVETKAAKFQDDKMEIYEVKPKATEEEPSESSDDKKQATESEPEDVSSTESKPADAPATEEVPSDEPKPNE